MIVATDASAQAPDELVLTDVTVAAGIDWVQTDDFTMMGAACAFLDYDGDGWQDILLAGGLSAPGLYRNLQGAGFVHEARAVFDVTPFTGYMCVTVGDVDNDGDPDVFFGRWGANLLYRNDGAGVFTDITTPALAGSVARAFTTAAAFGDYDADGNLDLYVGNYVRTFNFPNHTPEPNALFRGHGDGTFTEVTTPVLAGAGTALATTWSDFDADGDVDLLLGNDFGAFIEPNQVYRNDGPAPTGSGGPWSFVEASAGYGMDAAIYCMGIAPGDFDRDGDLDYYFTNLGRNVLLRNDGATFADVTTATGTEVTFDPLSPSEFATSWGCGFQDFDCDGWLDLYVSNGHIPSVLANGDLTPNTLLRHDGASLTYTETGGELDRGVGRGAAFADFDRDGDVDVLQGNIGAAPRLLRNDSPRRGAWLGARLTGRLSNRDAIGARVDVDLGDFVACREVSRNHSFESSSDPAVHVGAGAATRADRIAVRWPSGVEQQMHGVDLGGEIALTEAIVTVDAAPVRVWSLPFLQIALFEARITNHAQVAAVAAYAESFRLGGAGFGGLPAGASLWVGEARSLPLDGGQTGVARAVHLLPPRWLIPTGLDLDHLWMVTDAALGSTGGVGAAAVPALDEARIAVPLGRAR